MLTPISLVALVSLALTPATDKVDSALLRRISSRCGREIGWCKTWEQAAKRAAGEHKPVLVLVNSLHMIDFPNMIWRGPFMDEDVMRSFSGTPSFAALVERWIIRQFDANFDAAALQKIPDGMPVRFLFFDMPHTPAVLIIGIGVPVGVGLACGLINGLIVIGLRMHPFIVTLATMSISRLSRLPFRACRRCP